MGFDDAAVVKFRYSFCDIGELINKVKGDMNYYREDIALYLMDEYKLNKSMAMDTAIRILKKYEQ